MIALIKGNILYKFPDHLIIETNGMGYRVFMPQKSLEVIKIGDSLEVFTYMHIREDAMLLFGFLSTNDKEIFVKLLSISGLGPKTALAVLSNFSANDFMTSVQSGDSDAFAKVPGIGKKTAQRIILELKGKIDFNEVEKKDNLNNEVYSIASQGLLELGFTKSDIKNAFKQINLENPRPEDIIRVALKILAKV
jgi:holliday junction DNA helicase RuvA